MKRGALEKTQPGDLAIWKEITHSCDVCQSIADAPHRFRVAMPSSNCTFSRLVLIDLMTLEKLTAVPVVDVDTKFGAAFFVADASSKSI